MDVDSYPRAFDVVKRLDIKRLHTPPGRRTPHADRPQPGGSLSAGQQRAEERAYGEETAQGKAHQEADQETSGRPDAAEAGQGAALGALGQHTGGGGHQPAVAARVGGSQGSRRLSIYGTSATGPQIDELWQSFDAAIALCGPWANNVPNQPRTEALLPLPMPRRRGRRLQRRQGLGRGLRQATRDIQLRAVQAEKAQQVGRTGLKVLSRRPTPLSRRPSPSETRRRRRDPPPRRSLVPCL